MSLRLKEIFVGLILLTGSIFTLVGVAIFLLLRLTLNYGYKIYTKVKTSYG